MLRVNTMTLYHRSKCIFAIMVMEVQMVVSDYSSQAGVGPNCNCQQLRVTLLDRGRNAPILLPRQYGYAPLIKVERLTLGKFRGILT